MSKLLIFRPAGIGFMRPETCDYLCKLHVELLGSGYFEDVGYCDWKNYRSMMGRNGAIKTALETNCRYLLMIDPDMAPDIYVGKHKEAKKFFASSFQWLKDHPKGVVGAPAVQGRPRRNPNVYRAKADGMVRRLTHQQCKESVLAPTIEKVPCVGSGLMLIDTQALEGMEPPWFLDVYKDDTNTELKIGQDMYFTGNISKLGGDIWCNWHSWAGHIKAELLACPGLEVD